MTVEQLKEFVDEAIAKGYGKSDVLASYPTQHEHQETGIVIESVDILPEMFLLFIVP